MTWCLRPLNSIQSSVKEDITWASDNVSCNSSLDCYSKKYSILPIKKGAPPKVMKYKSHSLIFICQICKQIFPRLYLLNRHNYQVHKLKYCARCNLGFHSEQKLRSHIKVCNTYGKISSLQSRNGDNSNDPKVSIDDIKDDNFSPRWSCSLCSKTFIRKSSFVRHKLFSLCGSQNYLKKHMEEFAVDNDSATTEIENPDEVKTVDYKANRSAVKWQCDKCNKTFSRRISCLRHKRLQRCAKQENATLYDMAGDDILLINDIGKLSATATTIAVDTENDSIVDTEMCTQYAARWQCELCDKSFSTKSTRTRHIRQKHGNSANYSQVSESDDSAHPSQIDTTSEVATAMYTESVGSKKESMKRTLSWPCNTCHRSFKRKSSRTRHKLLKSCNARKQVIDYEEVDKCAQFIDGVKYYCCESCSYKTKIRSAIVKHESVHTGHREFVCDKCGKQFRFKSKLKIHFNDVHNDVRLFPCDICGVRFKNKVTCNEHRNIHTGDRPYVCDICGKSYKQKASLYIHKKFHLGTRTYFCAFCSKSFVLKSTLKEHEALHSDKREFKCHVCNKLFKTKAVMLEHVNVHSDERPFKCQLCGASFKRHNAMRQHQTKKKIKCYNASARALSPN